MGAGAGRVSRTARSATCRASIAIAAAARAAGTTVPVLVTPEGVLGESEAILAWVDERTPPEQRLFPGRRRTSAPRSNTLCRRLDERLGPTGRRLMYTNMLAAAQA